MINNLSNYSLISEIQRRACLFFYDKADSRTGLVNDRANNFIGDNYNVASVASTGYGLIALAVSVENKYLQKHDAYERALLTLKYINNHLINTEGWYFHFIDKNSGERVWDCEVSSIDTGLLIIGALICGQYFENTEVQELANILYDKMNWQFMLTNDMQQPNKLLLSHGLKPESGFLKSNWDTYCEHMFLYLLGLGTKNKPLSSKTWESWNRPTINYNGRTTLYGGPIFIHQMAHGFYNFKKQSDKLGWNYWNSSVEATHINREYCLNSRDHSRTYSNNIWGLSACDYPSGYKAFSAPGDEDGTVSPSGAISSIIFTPELSIEAANSFYKDFHNKMWGKYGFSNALNVDENWYDTDVIGIDLGMLLVNIENWQTGMIWKLLASHPSTSTAWEKAGFKQS